MKKQYTLVIMLWMLTFSAIAQVKVGDNPNTINSNSLMELESTSKGMLLPRVTLTSTSSFAPLTLHAQGMTVYNTATAGSGTTAVSPGYYYNDGTQWVRILNLANIKALEPWYDGATNTPATTNAQNIYHDGDVGIALNSGTTFTPSATLDVNGTSRIRSLPTGAVSDLLLSADANGNLRTIAASKSSVCVIGVLAGISTTRGAAGNSYTFTNGTVVLNTIENASFTGSTITLPSGNYNIRLVYEGTVSGSGTLISSYFFNFPKSGGTTQRIYSNTPTTLMSHGGTISYNTTLDATATFPFAIGWGLAGNVPTGAPVTFSKGVQLYIERLF
ncbi:hypothetical protein QWY99_08070 [Flavobacterium branchiarum]|uniref:Uncharacterized protein n=1 Tax=Flavobacterium branchiarum TaxID=1114870 RepID=A0ABV5FIX7_9FLAO|nr:hypothetical protein [Flavobacterium branchiarum]MDN3673005.1 hypothetical protein [Flavobacterium branchiarum]